MKCLPYAFWPLVIAAAVLLSSCDDKGIEIKADVTPADEEEPIPMLLDSSLRLEVLDVTTQLLDQKEDLDFGARFNDNRVQVGTIYRGDAEVEIRPYGESFQLAGYTFVLDGYHLTVDGEDLGTVSSSDQIRVSSGGVDVERG